MTSHSSSSRNRYYVLAILSLVYVVNVLDRNLIGILVQPIKEEFGVSDSAMGLLTGFAFVTFYVFAGIPLARLADRGNRRNILAAALSIWSVLTALCGLTRSFLQMAIVRVGVGVGEAAATPASMSMISDLYSIDRRATALALFTAGANVGTLFALPLGGWINDLYGWRPAFFIVALPGLLLALVVRLTVREPPRDLLERGQQIDTKSSLIDTLAHLWRVRSYRHIVLSIGFFIAILYAFYSFGAAFLFRSHGMSTSESGVWLGLLLGGVTAIGIVIGGVLTDRLQRRDERWNVWLPALALSIAAPAAALFVLLPETRAAIFFLGVFSVAGGGIAPASIYALTQSLVDSRKRAISAAVMLFTMNFIGGGVGPLLAGMVSDFLNASFGEESLRYGLLAVISLQFWGIVHLLLAARTIRSDLARARGKSPAEA